MVQSPPVGVAKLKTDGLILNPKLPSEVKEALIAAWLWFGDQHPDVFGDEAVGLATSGSTSGGAGSIIVLSRKALEASALAVNRRLLATSRDVWGLVLPLFHVGGFSIPVRAALSGSQFTEFAEKWDARKFHAWLKAERASLLSIVPTQLFDLAETGLESPPELRAIVVGGGRLDRALHDRAKAKGWPVLQSYGMTECCSQIATAMPGSDGLILETLDHVEVRTDVEQRLSVRSSSLLRARITFDAQFKATIEFPVDRDGWFRTSDNAHIEKIALSDGIRHHLTILGRDGEAVKVLGELVDLARIRNVFSEAADETPELSRLRRKTWVVAISHARRGHEIVLVIEGSEAELAPVRDRLFDAIRSRLAPFEIPSRTVFVDAIPRSSLGKVLSTLLTEMVLKNAAVGRLVV